MDQTRDLGGRQLYKLAKLLQAPDFVKKASVEDLCGTDNLPPETYGDPRRRLFPCHTPAATWASAAFFMDKQAELSPLDRDMIGARVQRCAELHGISHHIHQLKQAAEKQSRLTPDDELPDEDFAVVYADERGKQRHYRMRNALEVKAAAEYLHQHRDQLPYEIRQQMADRILQKQAVYGATLGPFNDFIEKSAGHGACLAQEAVKLIEDRVRASRKGPGPDNDLQQEMLKLAKLLVRHPSRLREPGMRVKLAATVDQFDRTVGLVGHYGDELPRVEDVLFSLTKETMTKCASEHIGLTSGNIYQMADLERVKLGELADYFGPDFAKPLTRDGLHVDGEKAAAFLSALPLPEARQLDRLLQDMGILPVVKEASAGVGFSEAHLRAMASWRKTAMSSQIT